MRDDFWSGETLETLGRLSLVRNSYGWHIRRTNASGSRSSIHAGQSDAEAHEMWGALLAKPRCRECGEPEPFHFDERMERTLAERQLCFSCNFWTLLVGRTDSVIVGGHHYVVKPDRPGVPDHCLGHGGSRFVIRFFDGRQVVTHNLWDQGQVPPHFLDRIPDNARFEERSASRYIGEGSASL